MRVIKVFNYWVIMAGIEINIITWEIRCIRPLNRNNNFGSKYTLDESECIRS